MFSSSPCRWGDLQGTFFHCTQASEQKTGAKSRLHGTLAEATNLLNCGRPSSAWVTLSTSLNPPLVFLISLVFSDSISVGDTLEREVHPHPCACSAFLTDPAEHSELNSTQMPQISVMLLPCSWGPYRGRSMFPLM